MKKRKDGSTKRKNMFGGEGNCPECGIGCGTCFGAGLSNAPEAVAKYVTELESELSALRAAQPLTRANLEEIARSTDSINFGPYIDSNVNTFISALLDSLADKGEE